MRQNAPNAQGGGDRRGGPGGGRTARNTGRALVVVIESADDSGLTALRTLGQLTCDMLTRQHVDISRWPEDIADLARTGRGGRLIPTVDSRGVTRHLALADCGTFDLLAGVASRRELNSDRGTRNVAMNVLLALLTPPAGTALPVGPYGTVYAAKRSRLWRNTAGAALLQDTMREWHVRLITDEGTIDFADASSTITGGVFSAQDAADADRFVRESTIYRRIKHEDGRASSARDKVAVFVRIDPVTGAYSYDHDVVAAIRQMAARLIEGWTYREIADEYAHLIPSYTLRGEPDRETGRHAKERTRAHRNELRRHSGRPEVPMKHLDDGITPNPAYRPETLADLEHPESAVRRLFEGPGASPQHPIPPEVVDVDLDGIAPDRGFLACYRDGRYRKLHRDLDASGKTFSRWRWSEYDLGTVDEHGHILTGAQVDAIERRIDDASITIVSGLPLVGVLDATLDRPIRTRYGTVRPEDGRITFSSARSAGSANYVIAIRPHADVRSSITGIRTVHLAKIPAGEMHRSVADALATVDTRLARTGTYRQPPRPGRRSAPARPDPDTLAAAEAAFEAATVALAEPGLSDAQRKVLQKHADRTEQQLEHARQAHTPDTDDTGGGETGAWEGDVRLGTLPDAAAHLAAADGDMPYGLAGDIRRLLRRLLTGTRTTVDPATGTVVWEADVTLTATDGTLVTTRVGGTVRSTLADDHLAGATGRFMHTERPYPQVWAETGQPDTSASRARARTAELLLDEHLQHDGGLPLRGLPEANLLVRCERPAIVTAAFDLLRGRATPDTSVLHRRTYDALFDGGKTGGAFTLRSRWQHEKLRPLLDVAGRG